MLLTFETKTYHGCGLQKALGCILSTSTLKDFTPLPWRTIIKTSSKSVAYNYQKMQSVLAMEYAQALTPGLYSQELGLALHDQVFGVTEVSSTLPD